MKKTKLRNLIYLGIAVLVLLHILIDSPNLNPLYLDGAMFWALLFSACLAVYAVFRYGEVLTYNGRVSVEFTEGSPKKLLALAAAPWAVIALVMVYSTPLLGSAAYRDQLGDPEVRTFSSDIQVMDQSQLPIVDRELAANLADKKLGERPSLGSQVYLGEPTKQLVNGELVWVVPLHHSGLFKWFTNMEGTPGYVVVSATNTNDVEYVEDYKIKIQPNSYLLDDLERHLRLHGALFDGIVDYSFELDESGQPYWIVTSYRNTRGFALPEATGVYLVNASTGEVQHCGMDAIPDWVDRVQPESFIVNQINNKGEYVHGIFNFSDKDKYRTSDGEAIIYNNGNCYLFTGLTSIGQDESAIGFIMVDMVTKRPILYQMNGATERSAQQSAQGKLQDLGYKADFPIILNVDGIATYFMPMKDSAGLIKQYAFVSVENYSSVGTGETIEAALRDYSEVLDQNQGGSIGAGLAGDSETTGTVSRVAAHVEGGSTVYSLVLAGEPGRIFTADSSLSAQLPITQPGDTVRLEYRDGDGYVFEVTAFANTTFTGGEALTEPGDTAPEEAPAEETPAEDTAPETPAA